VGLDPDPRSFKPHVTLARMRGVRNQAVARFLQENGGLRTQPFMVTRFVLLSARPGSGGPPYVIEAEYPFEGAGDWADEAVAS
jgi:RNA 2',3'-cyclic 3'-phosphodiesterase